jgi:hypothetical protein
MTRWKAICLFAWLPVWAAMFGCGKSTPEPTTPSPAAASPQKSTPSDVTLRIHWLGKKEISADRNSANLMKIWDLPETLKLQAQTLGKLSQAPWRLWLGQTNQTSGNLLLPLLNDVVTQECYLEARKATNAPDAPNEIVLSVHLSADQTDLWQAKLATVMESLGGTPESKNPAGWILRDNTRSNTIEFARAGEWSVLSMAQNHSALLDETIARINSQHTPVVDAATNVFLEGFVDLARLSNQSSSNALSKFSFALKLEEGSVVTTGELTLSGFEPLKLTPWNIPTNLISSNADSITAIRGFAPWLKSSPFWSNLKAGSPPDQCFVWATQESPMETYFIAPMADASNAAARITEFALRRQGPPWLTNALAYFEKSKNANGLSWRGFPYFTPFIRSAGTNGGNYLIGGFLDIDAPAGPPPAGVVESILSKSNLVYYDRELTSLRVAQWIQLGQAIRFIFSAAQLPGDSASFDWLKAIGAHLSSCSTEITQIGPDKLSLARKSDLGFSAIELHLLADWLESPEFPFGTYSVLVRAPEPPPL